MALPVTLAGTAIPNVARRLGPWRSAAGAVSVFVLDSADQSLIECWTATDPTAAFTEADPANKPNLTNNVRSLATYQVGDLVHVAALELVTGRVGYSTFDLGAGTWAIVNEQIQATTSIQAISTCDLTVRSDGDVIVLYQGTSSGSDLRVSYARRDAGAWTAGIAVDSGGAGTDWIASAVVLGAGDRVHFFYLNDATDDGFHRTLTAGNVLQTAAAFDVAINATALFQDIGAGVAYDAAGVIKIRVPYADSPTNTLGVVTFDSADLPTLGADLSVAGSAAVKQTNSVFNLCATAKGTDLIVLFANSADGDLYTVTNPDGAGWGATVKTFAGTVNHISATVLERGGHYKLAQLIDTSSAITYDEDDLGVAESVTTVTTAAIGSEAALSPPSVLALVAGGVVSGTIDGAAVVTPPAVAAGPVSIGLATISPGASGVPPIVTITAPVSNEIVVTLAGEDITGNVRITNTAVTITDLLDQQPNTARLRMWRGPKPPAGAEVKIGLGGVESLEQLLFAGIVRDVTQIYEGDRPANVAYDLSCIDYTWLLNRRKVVKYYPSQSATAIVLDLMANFTTGFTTGNVVPGLPTIDEITFTNEDLDDALTRIVRLIGGYWYIDYLKDLHVFLSEPTGNPALVSSADPNGAAGIIHSLDLSQIRTRVYVEGGGAQAAAEIPVGSLVVYVDDPSWYSPTGGMVIVGAQRITYTGTATEVITPGTPLANPGAATLSASVGTGGGRLAGAYRYKFTWHNGTGETLGSTASGTVNPAGVTILGALNGTYSGVMGALKGTYRYKVAYVTALGETLPGPASGLFTIPTVTVPSITAGLSTTLLGPIASGVYQYAQSYVTALGESLKGPIQSLTPTILDPPSGTAGTLSPTTGGNLTLTGAYNYRLTFETAYGETTGSVSASAITLTGSNNSVVISSIPNSSYTDVTARNLYRTVAGGTEYQFVAQIGIGTTSYTDKLSDAELGERMPSVNTAGGRRVQLSLGIVGGVTGILARNLYRTKKGGSIFYLIGQLPDNTSSNFDDLVPDEALTQQAPLMDSAGGQQLNLNSIPTATPGGGVLARRIYRTKSGGTEYYLVDQISNNTTTTYTDNTADAALTQQAPIVSTAGGQPVTLSSVDVGPAGTTDRRIYRTLAGGNDYLYAGTIHNNTATTYTDNLPDDNLGSPIPTVNSSGGRPVSVTSLTGVPASGAGSVLYPIPKGEAVNILITRNDAAAQSALALAVGGDGIHEHYIQDNRLAQVECEARGDAELEAFKSPIETVTLTTRDPAARTGKTLELALSAPTSINGSYKIQTVTISQVGTSTAFPLRSVSASSQRYSLEELLRVRRPVG